MNFNGVKLDQDAIDILRLTDKHGEITTTDAKNALSLSDNDYTRRRIKKLEAAGLVDSAKIPISTDSHILVTQIVITEDGREFIDSWNLDGLGEGLPLGERVDRLERRVDSLETQHITLQQELADQDVVDELRSKMNRVESQLTELQDAFRMVRNYLVDGVNANLKKYAPGDHRRPTNR